MKRNQTKTKLKKTKKPNNQYLNEKKKHPLKPYLNKVYYEMLLDKYKWILQVTIKDEFASP